MILRYHLQDLDIFWKDALYMFLKRKVVRIYERSSIVDLDDEYSS